jgi:hypothetical protein
VLRKRGAGYGRVQEAGWGSHIEKMRLRESLELAKQMSFLSGRDS